jgi:hypothetical protein
MVILDFPEIDLEFEDLGIPLPSYSLRKRASSDRVRQLRRLMRDRGIGGYLIVDSDAHYTFYAQARRDRRINYITHSEVYPSAGVWLTKAQCGIAVVGSEKAAFKPLNAYLLMADLETDETWEILPEAQSLEGWMRREIHGQVGYDPELTPICICPS